MPSQRMGGWREPTEADLEIKESQLITRPSPCAVTAAAVTSADPAADARNPTTNTATAAAKATASPHLPHPHKSPLRPRRVSGSAFSALGLRIRSSFSGGGGDGQGGSNTPRAPTPAPPGAFPGNGDNRNAGAGAGSVVETGAISSARRGSAPAASTYETADPSGTRAAASSPGLSISEANGAAVGDSLLGNGESMNANRLVPGLPELDISSRNPLLRSVSHLAKDAPSQSQLLGPVTSGAGGGGRCDTERLRLQRTRSAAPLLFLPGSGTSVSAAAEEGQGRRGGEGLPPDSEPPPYQVRAASMDGRTLSGGGVWSVTTTPSVSSKGIVFTSPFTGMRLRKNSTLSVGDSSGERAAMRRPSLPSLLSGGKSRSNSNRGTSASIANLRASSAAAAELLTTTLSKETGRSDFTPSSTSRTITGGGGRRSSGSGASTSTSMSPTLPRLLPGSSTGAARASSDLGRFATGNQSRDSLVGGGGAASIAAPSSFGPPSLALSAAAATPAAPASRRPSFVRGGGGTSLDEIREGLPSTMAASLEEEAAGAHLDDAESDAPERILIGDREEDEGGNGDGYGDTGSVIEHTMHEAGVPSSSIHRAALQAQHRASTSIAPACPSVSGSGLRSRMRKWAMSSDALSGPSVLASRNNARASANVWQAGRKSFDGSGSGARNGQQCRNGGESEELPIDQHDRRASLLLLWPFGKRSSQHLPRSPLAHPASASDKASDTAATPRSASTSAGGSDAAVGAGVDGGRLEAPNARIGGSGLAGQGTFSGLMRSAFKSKRTASGPTRAVHSPPRPQQKQQQPSPSTSPPTPVRNRAPMSCDASLRGDVAVPVRTAATVSPAATFVPGEAPIASSTRPPAISATSLEAEQASSRPRASAARPSMALTWVDRVSLNDMDLQRSQSASGSSNASSQSDSAATPASPTSAFHPTSPNTPALAKADTADEALVQRAGSSSGSIAEGLLGASAAAPDVMPAHVHVHSRTDVISVAGVSGASQPASAPEVAPIEALSGSAGANVHGICNGNSINSRQLSGRASQSEVRHLPRLNSMRAVSNGPSSMPSGGDGEDSDHDGHQSGNNVGYDYDESGDLTTDDEEEVSESEHDESREPARDLQVRPGHLSIPPAPRFASFGGVQFPGNLGRESWVAFNGATPSLCGTPTPDMAAPYPSQATPVANRNQSYFSVIPPPPSAQTKILAEDGGPPPSPSVITRSRPPPWATIRSASRTGAPAIWRVSSSDVSTMPPSTFDSITKPTVTAPSPSVANGKVTMLAASTAAINRGRPSTSGEVASRPDFISHSSTSMTLQQQRNLLASRGDKRADKRREMSVAEAPASTTSRLNLYHQMSRSLIDLSTAADRRMDIDVAEPQMVKKADFQLKIPETTLIAPANENPPGGIIAQRPGLQRRCSMFEIRQEPPPYSILHWRPEGPQVIYPREEEGKEKLPQYGCHVHIEGYLPRKMEFSSPGVQARDRSWRRLYFVLHGTMLRVYRQDLSSVHKGMQWGDMSGVHVHPKPINEDDSPAGGLASARDAMSSLHIGHSNHFKHQPLRTYTMQGAESGLAADYLKRRHVVRVRAEGEQFLLQTKDDRHVVDWIEALQAATNVAMDLETRPMPKFITLPRRRRRRRHNPDGTAASPTTEREAADLAEAQRRSLADQNGSVAATTAGASGRRSRDEVNAAFNLMISEDQENMMSTRQASVI